MRAPHGVEIDTRGAPFAIRPRKNELGSARADTWQHGGCEPRSGFPLTQQERTRAATRPAQPLLDPVVYDRLDIEAAARMVASENPRGSDALKREQIYTQIKVAKGPVAVRPHHRRRRLRPAEQAPARDHRPRTEPARLRAGLGRALWHSACREVPGRAKVLRAGPAERGICHR